MKKITFEIAKENGKETVEGEKVSPYYAIYKRPDHYYALTHLPSGYLVQSARTKTRLKLLAAEPEFFDSIDVDNPEHVMNIARAVKRFNNKMGWK